MNIRFSARSLTVREVARLLGKNEEWVRKGIVAGWLPIGVATRNGEKVTDPNDVNDQNGRINFYISQKLLYDFTGLIVDEKDV